jgi:hypothetical protein
VSLSLNVRRSIAVRVYMLPSPTLRRSNLLFKRASEPLIALKPVVQWVKVHIALYFLGFCGSRHSTESRPSSAESLGGIAKRIVHCILILSQHAIGI